MDRSKWLNGGIWWSQHGRTWGRGIQAWDVRCMHTYQSLYYSVLLSLSSSGGITPRFSTNAGVQTEHTGQEMVCPPSQQLRGSLGGS